MTGQYIVQGIFALAGNRLPAGVIAELGLVLYNAQCTNHCPKRRTQPSTTLLWNTWELSSLEWLYSSLWKHGKPSLFETFFQTKEHKYKRLQKYVLLFLCLKQLS